MVCATRGLSASSGSFCGTLVSAFDVSKPQEREVDVLAECEEEAKVGGATARLKIVLDVPTQAGPPQRLTFVEMDASAQLTRLLRGFTVRIEPGAAAPVAASNGLIVLPSGSKIYVETETGADEEALAQEKGKTQKIKRNLHSSAPRFHPVDAPSKLTLEARLGDQKFIKASEIVHSIYSDQVAEDSFRTGRVAAVAQHAVARPAESGSPQIADARSAGTPHTAAEAPVARPRAANLPDSRAAAAKRPPRPRRGAPGLAPGGVPIYAFKSERTKEREAKEVDQEDRQEVHPLVKYLMCEPEYEATMRASAEETAMPRGGGRARNSAPRAGGRTRGAGPRKARAAATGEAAAFNAAAPTEGAAATRVKPSGARGKADGRRRAEPRTKVT